MYGTKPLEINALDYEIICGIDIQLPLSQLIPVRCGTRSTGPRIMSEPSVLGASFCGSRLHHYAGDLCV